MDPAPNNQIFVNYWWYCLLLFFNLEINIYVVDFSERSFPCGYTGPLKSMCGPPLKPLGDLCSSLSPLASFSFFKASHGQDEGGKDWMSGDSEGRLVLVPCIPHTYKTVCFKWRGKEEEEEKDKERRKRRGRRTIDSITWWPKSVSV